MPCQPRIEEPSNPSPSVNADVPNAPIGSVMCCQLPEQVAELEVDQLGLLLGRPRYRSSACG